MILSGLTPHFNASLTSCIDTASIPDPRFIINFRIEIFDNALTA